MPYVEQNSDQEYTSTQEVLVEFPLGSEMLMELSKGLTDQNAYLDALWGVHDIYQILKDEKRTDLLPIVGPAYIFHESGWKDAYNSMEAPNLMSESQKIVLHADNGARQAKKVLTNLGYPKPAIEEIADMIKHHDDRYLFADEDSTRQHGHGPRFPESAAEVVLFDARTISILRLGFWEKWYSQGRWRRVSPSDFLQMQIAKQGITFTSSGTQLAATQFKDREAEIRYAHGNGLDKKIYYKAFYELTKYLNKKAKELDGIHSQDPSKVFEILDGLYRNRISIVETLLRQNGNGNYNRN